MSSGVLFVHSLSSDDFDNHVTHDSHHSGTSVVDLSVKLAGLFFRVEVLSEPTNSVVSVVLGCRQPSEFDKGEEGKDLKKSGVGDGTDSVNSGGDIGEFEVLRRGKVSIENNVVVVDDDTDNGSHGNTSVLSLDSPTTFEGLRLGFQPSKRIVNSKRSGNTDLELIDVQCGGGLCLLGRGKSSRGGDKGGKDSGLHFVYILFFCKNTNSRMKLKVSTKHVFSGTQTNNPGKNLPYPIIS